MLLWIPRSPMDFLLGLLVLALSSQQIMPLLKVMAFQPHKAAVFYPAIKPYAQRIEGVGLIFDRSHLELEKFLKRYVISGEVSKESSSERDKILRVVSRDLISPKKVLLGSSS